MAKFIVANWKSNKNLVEAQSWADGFAGFDFDHEKSKIIIAPPSPFLETVRAKLHDRVFLASQDISPYPAGSYTGAVSARNLSGLAEYAIVGHSERREYFSENHQQVANKVEQAISLGIIPIVCVDSGYISEQAMAIDSDLLSKCIVAYEPLSAIGTGNNVPVSDVTEVTSQIKQKFGDVPVIYGGSVTRENVSEYLLVCDGVLVGGVSLDLSEFISLIKMAERR